MPSDIDIDLSLALPDLGDDDVEQLVIDVLREAIEEAETNLRTGRKSWVDRTGTLSASFRRRDVDGGGQLRNEARYSAAVVEFKGAPPLRVLTWIGINELAARKLEERGDDMALAVLVNIMEPILDEVRRGN